MKHRLQAICLLLPLLLSAGCAHRLGIERPLRVRTVARTPAELQAATAPFRGLAARLRQSVIISYQGRELLLSGLLVLDPVAGTAQLLASQDLGPVALALTVSADGYVLLRPARPPYDHPRLVAGVADSIRRMFLTPPDSASMTFERGPRVYRSLSGSGPAGPRCLLGGEPLVLLEADGQAENGPWRVMYGTYRQGAAGFLPMAIVYEEPKNHLRITVWNESVER